MAGELNVDLILHGAHAFPKPGKEVIVDDVVMTLGSASAICAMGLGRLGHEVTFIGKVGTDSWGEYCVETLVHAGIDALPVIRDPGLRTGVTVSITSPRDRALVSYLGAIGALTADEIAEDEFRHFAHMHVSSYYLQEGLRPGLRGLFARARGFGLTTSLDPGFDPAERWGRDIVDTLAEVDVFLPNEVELRAIAGVDDVQEALRRLDNGRTRIVAKLGARGCMTLEDGRVLAIPAFPTEPLDTTGAGDNFDAGFLHAWLEGRPLRDCLRWGTACGSLSTRALGGIEGQAHAEEVEQLIASAS